MIPEKCGWCNGDKPVCEKCRGTGYSVFARQFSSVCDGINGVSSIAWKLVNKLDDIAYSAKVSGIMSVIKAK